jgi:tRNA (guanosine-2'-O-)-methyltransferase
VRCQNSVQFLTCRLSGEVMELVDVAIKIPMIGAGASLNVAVAGSLVLCRLAGFL